MLIGSIGWLSVGLVTLLLLPPFADLRPPGPAGGRRRSQHAYRHSHRLSGSLGRPRTRTGYSRPVGLDSDMFPQFPSPLLIPEAGLATGGACSEGSWTVHCGVADDGSSVGPAVLHG